LTLSSKLSGSYNYTHFTIKPYNRWYKEFLKHLPLGSKAPDFKCLDTDGRKVTLAQFRGRKFVVLEFGCMTCAPAVTQSATYNNSLSRMAAKFASHGVEFLMVYTRETHPGENIKSHKKFEEKVEHAKLFKELERLQLRLLVDSLEGKIHRKYGMLPNMVYVINKEGRIVYKASWTDSKEIESVLENLLLWEKEGFTPMDSVAVVEKYHFIYDRNVEEHRRIYERAGKTAVEDLRKEVKLLI
jgi:peroxiredoxin